MDTGDRVALRANPSWTGRVRGVEAGVVTVDGDDGWKARCLPVDALAVVPEDKAWPPSGMEHKALSQQVADGDPHRY